MSPDELISVVIPTYNRAGTLKRAIDSVLNQDYRNIEVIVVDDASSDGTGEILAAMSDPRLRVVVHDTNRGVAAATNTGIRAARGAYVAFQDSDDEWLHGKLTRQAAQFAAAPKDCVCVYCIKIVYGRDPQFDRGNRRVACVPGPGVAEVAGRIAQRLWQGNIVSPQTAICDRAAVLELGGFDERLRADQDWDFFSRLAETGSFGFVDAPLVNTYIQPDSISLFSRRSLFSQVVICNKMRKRGVPVRVLAGHWARLGSRMSRHEGMRRRARILLRAALAARPKDPRIWVRLALTRLPRRA